MCYNCIFWLMGVFVFALNEVAFPNFDWTGNTLTFDGRKKSLKEQSITAVQSKFQQNTNDFSVCVGSVMEIPCFILDVFFMHFLHLCDFYILIYLVLVTEGLFM